MLKIFKYQVPFADEGSFSLDLPEGAKILTVQTQREQPQIWALVDPDKPAETRNFLSFATGSPIRENIENLSYIGTYQERTYVWHIFETLK